MSLKGSRGGRRWMPIDTVIAQPAVVVARRFGGLGGGRCGEPCCGPCCALDGFVLARG